MREARGEVGQGAGQRQAWAVATLHAAPGVKVKAGKAPSATAPTAPAPPAVLPKAAYARSTVHCPSRVWCRPGTARAHGWHAAYAVYACGGVWAGACKAPGMPPLVELLLAVYGGGTSPARENSSCLVATTPFHRRPCVPCFTRGLPRGWYVRNHMQQRATARMPKARHAPVRGCS